MNGRSSFDSNLLIYTDDQDAPDKQRIALQLIEGARLNRAALRSGCSVLFSEDRQSGRKIEGLEIVNPFAPTTAR